MTDQDQSGLAPGWNQYQLSIIIPRMFCQLNYSCGYVEKNERIQRVKEKERDGLRGLERETPRSEK